MATPTPRQELARAIERWEGLYSDHPNDQGNYIGPKLVGTMRGVTGATLAAHRGIPPESVTAEMVKSVTLEEAADIGEQRLYHGAFHIDTLPWGPTTAILLDWTWGSGFWSIRALQRLLNIHVDGAIGPQTREAYVSWVSDLGWEATTRQLVDARRAFYLSISKPGTPNAVFREGWLNRCVWQSPANAEWWSSWTSNMPPLPVPYKSPGKPTPVAAPQPVRPASQSRTLKSAAVAAGGGAVTAVDKVTDGGVTEIITETTTKLIGFTGVGGVIMWIAIGLTVAGAAYAIWRVVDDRRVPG